MAPNRTPHTQVPATPYSRPRKFDTARVLFQRMLQEETPMPTKKLFAATLTVPAGMPNSPPLTPEDEETSTHQSAPTPAPIRPSTPPPTLPRAPTTACPKLARAKKSVVYLIPPALVPPAPRALSDADGELCLGSPLQLAAVPFNGDLVTPRKSTPDVMVAPWAPLRPSFRPSSAYGPRVALRQPCFQQVSLCSSPSSNCSTPTKYMDRQTLVGRINKLESVVRNLQRELAAHKARRASSTPTKASAINRRTVKSSPKSFKKQRPIQADAVFL